MHWRRVAAVQEVTATIVRVPTVVDDVTDRLSAKSALFDELRIARGEDWIAVFAASLSDETGVVETILPVLGGIPLYEEAAGWWLPVGVEIAAPAHARASLREALATVHAPRGAAIVVPRFADDKAPTDRADLYAIGVAMPLSRYRLAAA